MKKYNTIGVNKRGKCCILSCVVPFSSFNANEIEASDFKHDCTNWGGCDDLERTLGLQGYKLTGNKIELPKPITFHGSNSDMGHNYSWEFDVYEILEIE